MIFSLTISLKERPTKIWQENVFSYWNQYYQSHSVTSSKAAKMFLDKMKWNDVQMKSKTYDTWNRQVVWDKSGRQIVLCEVISCKVEISWSRENQALKRLWRKLSDCKIGLRNFVVTLKIQVSNSLQWMAKIWDKWKTYYLF